ncbi:MAG: universal stress protein [Methyloligellaceae bacterium]
MKSILVPIEDSHSLSSQLHAMALVARMFDAVVEGVAPRLVFGPNVFGDFVSAADVAAVEELEEEQNNRVQKLRQIFENFARENDLPLIPPNSLSEKCAAAWISNIAAGDEAIGQKARLYDLSVIARPVSDQQVPRASLLESILFESGHPQLVVPPKKPDSLGENILVAWNGSSETARATYFSMPFLRRARNIVILKVAGGSVLGPDTTDLQFALSRHGIETETRDIAASDLPIGEVILSEAAKMGADMLVKGAYTQSRLRQMIFGGATSYIMANAEIPVLMAH